ncbi:glycine betaine ABC transporter substrate-binding protein [Solibacillus sp. FSL W7-1472]|uniref:ABC-type proline/glycine betaine transport systems, periplasmic component n=2 Tax=Solibacillus TaxID=648800 RepID=F2F0I7_SOLSS|nr:MULTISPECIES: glycine betaine ABC transporter substrate-binding protein [Solibacillus]AMO86229.1 glycine/betaine ABC transporter [Solibacillus silvestris]EKB45779.1 Glycine betaine-binding protein precursor [Solibacillus isronensis B3W22]MCM3720632.1 glycine/betaine ABC transporter [Solibacillus isronensis]OBW59821.1 glycine/betaine ABC transporter [Solibacillus silvestris]BAK15762.1 ABC-type proline/glycine betaine transport systems, periplasmic component [Solibacillus silvestris StLB046]
MSKIKTMGITLGMSSALLLAACGDDTENKESSAGASSSSIGEQVDYTVVATEPGAGLTGLSHEVMEQYENLEGWTLQESSTAGMLSTLDKAIRNEEPVIVTGWTPHWKFSAYDLKILEDPKGILGGAENIQTLARKGLEQDLPDVYTVLDRFYWEPEDMEKVMYDAQENGDFDVAAADWVENNQDKVSEWTKDIAQGNGEKVKIISTPWDSEFASSSVIKLVLEQLGYEPEVTPVDPAIMFQSIATGEGDVTVAPWLPTTHKAFYDKHKDDIVDLGENLEGTQNGFVVPAYVEIDSIEDLKPKE